VIDELGIGRRIESELGEHVFMILYSSWCKEARGSIPDAVAKARSMLEGYEIVGVFADDEVGQVVDAPVETIQALGMTSMDLRQLKQQYDNSRVLRDVVEPARLFDDAVPIRRVRMPRAQWEDLGGALGRVKVVCFTGGQHIDCRHG
jgi:hypothetical protein